MSTTASRSTPAAVSDRVHPLRRQPAPAGHPPSGCGDGGRCVRFQPPGATMAATPRPWPAARTDRAPRAPPTPRPDEDEHHRIGECVVVVVGQARRSPWPATARATVRKSVDQSRPRPSQRATVDSSARRPRRGRQAAVATATRRSRRQRTCATTATTKPSVISPTSGQRHDAEADDRRTGTGSADRARRRARRPGSRAPLGSRRSRS